MISSGLTKFEIFVGQAAINLGATKPFNFTIDKIVDWGDNKNPPTDDALNAEIDRLEVEYNAQEYARTRKTLYPNIGDQLDDLYKKGAFSDEMAAKIKKVKDDNPKPS